MTICGFKAYTIVLKKNCFISSITLIYKLAVTNAGCLQYYDLIKYNVYIFCRNTRGKMKITLIKFCIKKLCASVVAWVHGDYNERRTNFFAYVTRHWTNHFVTIPFSATFGVARKHTLILTYGTSYMYDQYSFTIVFNSLNTN